MKIEKSKQPIRCNYRQEVKKVEGKPFLESSTVIWFGKYKGFYVQRVLEQDAGYMVGLSKGNFFTIDRQVLNSAYAKLGWLTLKKD